MGGSTNKLTLNGIPADATAGQALGYIKNYVDKHAQMYEPNGVPSAQNIAGNYSDQLQSVADQAQKDFPGDPGMQQLYMNHYQQQAGQAIRAQQMTDRANNSVVFNALTGPNPVSSWPEFNSDPQRKAAFDALYKTDASIHDKVDKAINVNAWKSWDPPATQKTNDLYNQLNGMSTTDRGGFSKLEFGNQIMHIFYRIMQTPALVMVNLVLKNIILLCGRDPLLDIHRKPEEILKGRQTLTPKEYGEWIAAVHGRPPDEVAYDPETDIIWQKRKFDWATGWPDRLPDSNPAWKPKRKPVKTMGHSLRSFADLAVLTRAWRKPIFKNIRYLYVKDGVIVGYERARHCVPANALFMAGDPGKALKHIKARIAGLGADSFFMVHNQYYVYSTPSAVDRKLAAILSKAPGLKGHIILNPCCFGLITIKGIAILRVLPDIGIPCTDPVTGAYLNATAAMDYPVLTIAHWAKALTRRKRPVLISIRDETVLSELQEISLDRIDTWNQLVDIMAKGEDPAFEGSSLDEAGPLLKHGGRYYILPPDKGRSPEAIGKDFPA